VRSDATAAPRSGRGAAWVALLAVALSGCAPKGRGVAIVTTTDVMGKTSPCGCHTPKGGLARRAAFLDSLRSRRDDVLVLDAGGFFPHSDDEREAAPFLLAEMARMGTAGAGVAASELRFGYSYAREHARAAGVPLLCANLVRFDGGLPAFEAGRVYRAGGVKVGVFGLLREDADLGPARDSLRVDPPLPAARRAVQELRAQGAQVVVALAQLGRAASESLGVQVPGIDLVVSGGGVPVEEKSRPAGGARVLHAGAQGWYVGFAEARLDASGRLRGLDARTIELGPGVRTEPAMAARVKLFEDSLNASMRRRQASFGASLLDKAAPHYVGQSGCVECHKSQYAQWRTTAHARAWRTLVDQQKESTTRCVPCHVTGHGLPGGFRNADDAARFGDVQCEACHGMGTDHRFWKEQGSQVDEQVCRSCHTSETSPTFVFAEYRAHVLHSPPPGLRPLPESPARRLMREGRDPHAR
jgi:hypothetical protein